MNFKQYLEEQKNLHMTHIEDLIFDQGVAGTKRALDFLRELRNMLAGDSSGSISRTTKFDGAPAVFVGVDPADGKFFVAKKGLFNKDPKMYKSVADVKADTSGDLQKKLIASFNEFSKLGIKSGVYQGDLMFTSGDISTETIHDKKYYTFQPNTIVYAVPTDTPLGHAVRSASIGVVWHTTYSGSSIESMTASFGKGIVDKFNKVRSIWQQDAVYQDVTGQAVFTAQETAAVTSILSNVGKLFNKIPAGLFNSFHQNSELLIRVHAFNNMSVKAGIIPNPAKHAKDLRAYIFNHYQQQIDTKKTDKSKEEWKAKQDEAMKPFKEYSMADFTNLFTLMNYMVEAKIMIVNKMNQAGNLDTFLRTTNGFKVTNPEGFVCIDHATGGAVKLVDRLTFSKANFSPDILKGWER